ncbi:hypothetical protein E6C27_scaffold3G00210 [Cucumis melo var. makuwa]|uniref:Uncharacterized protein n=1 Tax=Cucumis melo var. makuwa TaxID=1194695 RepID=A0A5A7T7G1_CUCMM|nr:hypothetical protein E6C27_scaffold3G00210 [Cucumis melo var. makuwa]
MLKVRPRVAPPIGTLRGALVSTTSIPAHSLFCHLEGAQGKRSLGAQGKRSLSFSFLTIA